MTGHMQFQSNAIARLLTERAKPRKRQPRGRPRKRDAGHYADILEGHRGILDWHLETFGEPARSEAALYRAFRQHVEQTVSAQGVREMAARDAVIGPRLKTVANKLAEARAFFRNHPEQTPFSGTDFFTHPGSNQHEEECAK